MNSILAPRSPSFHAAWRRGRILAHQQDDIHSDADQERRNRWQNESPESEARLDGDDLGIALAIDLLGLTGAVPLKLLDLGFQFARELLPPHLELEHKLLQFSLIDVFFLLQGIGLRLQL